MSFVPFDDFTNFYTNVLFCNLSKTLRRVLSNYPYDRTNICHTLSQLLLLIGSTLLLFL